MNKKYNLKLDLQFRCNNSTMKFNQFDNNTSDFFMRITNGGNLVDIEKAIVVLAVIKPSGKIASQFVEVENGLVYADLKPNMRDEIGTYTAQAMLILEDERVVTDVISYEVEEDKIFSLLNDTVETSEEFTLLTDMLSRLSTVEISEEQRMINEAERILSEENRKIEEAKRVEAELIRQHEEADRAKYDATRESNENIRKQNESIRLANETNRIDEEAKRVKEETKRVEAEQLRNANYNFMTEDEERRRLEANAHKEAETLRVQAETNRVNEEAKRRTTEQARVSAENTRVNNENTREANEVVRKNNETKRVEAETQRQNRYNSFIADAEANANNFENYTNTAKVKEEERKSNELDRKSQEARRVSNEVERISNENTRKANEKAREKNETSRQYVFENKVDEVDSKISELDNTKSDMATSINNKVNEVENRFNALTSKQQQDAEVIDARDGETSLKARLDRDIEKAKQVYVDVEGSHISSDSSVGYAKDVEILGNTTQDSENLADIRSVGDTVEGQELYEIPIVSCGKNLINVNEVVINEGVSTSTGSFGVDMTRSRTSYIKFNPNVNYVATNVEAVFFYDKNKQFISVDRALKGVSPSNCNYIVVRMLNATNNWQLEEGTVATPYEPYQEDKLTILSPVQIEKVGDIEDRIIEKDGVLGVEKNIVTYYPSLNKIYNYHSMENSFRVSSNSTDAIVTPKTSRSICNLLIEGTGSDWTSDKQCCYVLTNNTLVIKGDIRNASNLEEAREWIKSSGLYIKYPTTQPQFIPLPHDQQIKLRTFAGKTNISFLTEIEGTIKAQVPKSLGATVNTHTEQIRSLNNELNRVKKLEESTVSTVTTESDFTTVEATSNGYFEDVKLEGKTLVNLVQNAKEHTLTRESVESGFAQVKCDTYILDKNKDYTAIYIQISREGNTPKFSINNVETDNVDYYNIALFDTSTTGYEVVIKKINRSYNWQTMRLYYDSKYTGTTKFKLLLLEGDHTQNPPSYFEGLKSVGEDVDEISVESVNENLIPNIKFKKGGTDTPPYNNLALDNTRYRSLGDFIFLPKGEYYINSNQSVSSQSIAFKVKDMFGKDIIGVTDTPFTFNNPINQYVYIFGRKGGGEWDLGEYPSDIGLTLTKGKDLNSYTPHQSDKKRLLYYNTETQAWEKPILRQWDSIEKHANGKYYYHQRSAEGVLNGSEDWGTNEAFSTGDYIACLSNSALSDKKQGVLNIISDKFNTKNCALIPVLEEGMWGEVGNSILYMSISKSKLSTQDVAGFKQWLQTNNVTVVYQLAQEKVYECTNIDLITYANETNYVVECGAIVPKSTLKVHNNISNVVSLLQKKVSLLESDVTSYMITQNRLMLASRYNADTVSFKVDVATLRNSFEYDNDLYELILNNILVGKDNYNREYIENLIIFYWMDFVISDEMHSTLFEIIEEQHNPKVIEEETPLI